jgi:hypothetical protein
MVAANSKRKEDSGCNRWHQKKRGSSSKTPISKNLKQQTPISNHIQRQTREERRGGAAAYTQHRTAPKGGPHHLNQQEDCQGGVCTLRTARGRIQGEGGTLNQLGKASK